MSKKIILLALAAASLAAFALPATAMAAEEDEALHLIPAPLGAKAITGGPAILSAAFTTPLECTSSAGTANFANGTTGTLTLTFHGCKQGATHCQSAGQPTGTIVTKLLEFHLVTVVHEHNAAISGPGILVTLNGGVFFDVVCTGAITVKGTGLVGTLSTKCNESRTESTITFTSPSAGRQTHTTVLQKDPATGKTGTTPTSYSLTAFAGFIPAALNASVTINLGTPPKLECT